MHGVILASAPQIVTPCRDAVSKFASYITQDGALATFLMILGGLVLLTSILLVILQKWWPNNALSRWAMQVNIAWAIAGMFVGLLLILPEQVAPFCVAILLTVVQFILNIFCSVFGL